MPACAADDGLSEIFTLTAGMFSSVTSVSTADGEHGAVAPLVISASRATDIPALHVEWLLERLRAGCGILVFWSKNPALLLTRLQGVASASFTFYFHFTLNDYEREGLEPGLPPLAERVETFVRLSQRVGGSA